MQLWQVWFKYEKRYFTANVLTTGLSEADVTAEWQRAYPSGTLIRVRLINREAGSLWSLGSMGCSAKEAKGE